MRVAYALQGLLAASTTMAASYNPQHVVLGTDGTVVVDVDPSLYFRPSKNHRDEVRLESERQLVEFDLKLPDAIQAETSELPLVPLPALHEELLLEDDFDGNVQVMHEDEFSAEAAIQDATLSTTWSSLTAIDMPGVYGSVVFAELSCCFVVFIGYLLNTVPLWVGFSSSQKCCLIVAFSFAFLYQFAALGWLFGAVTPELMLGLSSLITRMISLGMVPITTTSFMGRAREICQDHAAMTSAKPRKPHSRHSCRHHSRARSS